MKEIRKELKKREEFMKKYSKKRMFLNKVNLSREE